jgi:transcriptional regulator with XRE-family HTH domain
MNFGDVLKRERERRGMTTEDTATALGLSVLAYSELETGSSQIEQWAPKLAELAINLSTPTSRLISPTGKSEQDSSRHTCGDLITRHREKRGLSRQRLCQDLGWSESLLESIENGSSPIEQYGPVVLRFAEIVEQPVFNLFYPCGLPFAELSEYP